ncbi:hypothetical protein [Metabacillus sp. cB07]|uniref:hypothetical protein n=1 Tax=Metabacillus sp. cB07 TaxID=2806989 RepID=UPI00193A8C1D|nr:hypothetical protein [Metabacillus sp. cB07]
MNVIRELYAAIEDSAVIKETPERIRNVIRYLEQQQIEDLKKRVDRLEALYGKGEE